MFISFSPVPHFSDFSGLWLRPFSFSCILFLTICCSLFFLCHHFLLTLCREESFYCTVPITPVKREVEELDNIEEVSRVARLDMHGLPCQNARGYQSPMLSLDQQFSKYIGHTLLCCYHSPAPARNWLGYSLQWFLDVVYYNFPDKQYVLVLSPS